MFGLHLAITGEKKNIRQLNRKRTKNVVTDPEPNRAAMQKHVNIPTTFPVPPGKKQHPYNPTFPPQSAPYAIAPTLAFKQQMPTTISKNCQPMTCPFVTKAYNFLVTGVSNFIFGGGGRNSKKKPRHVSQIGFGTPHFCELRLLSNRNFEPAILFCNNSHL